MFLKLFYSFVYSLPHACCCVLLTHSVLNSLSHRIILVSVIRLYLHSVPVFHHFRPTESNQTLPFAVILLFIVQVALKCSSRAITNTPKINPNHPKCVLLGVKNSIPLLRIHNETASQKIPTVLFTSII